LKALEVQPTTVLANSTWVFLSSEKTTEIRRRQENFAGVGGKNCAMIFTAGTNLGLGLQNVGEQEKAVGAFQHVT